MSGKDVLLMNLALRLENRKPEFFDIGPPYGLAMIAAVLRNSGFSVKGIDFNEMFLDESLAYLRRFLKKYRPRIAGVSCESWTRGSFLPTIRCIREYSPATKIVVGGSYATQYYVSLLKKSGVDCIVLGEGEISMRDVVQNFLRGAPLKDIPGIAYYKKGGIVTTGERKLLLDLDSLPYPAYDVFDIKERIRPALKGSMDSLGFDPVKNFVGDQPCSVIRRSLVFLSARGCIGSCVFCPNSKISKHKIRIHSVTYFLDMIEFFEKKYHLRDFIFGDNFFAFNRKRTLDICRGILERDLNIRWAIATRFDQVDRSLLRCMARAGCVNIGYGLESYSSAVQKNMGKNLDLSKMENAYRMTHQLGMNSELMLMVGNPGDCQHAVKETLNKVRHIDPTIAYTQVAQVYPNTKLFDLACEKGVIAPSFFENEGYEVPAYTGEHSESELKLLASMIQDRIVYMGLVKAKERERLSFAQRLSLASARSRRLAFEGEDPLMHRDFLKILGMVRAAGTNLLHVYTSARLLQSPAAVSKLRATGVEIRLMVPFFGVTAQDHDAITGAKGSFYQSLEGMHRWGNAIAGLYVTKESCNLMEEFVRKYLHKHFSGVEFIFYAGSGWGATAPHENIPQWGRIRSDIKKAIDFALAQGGRCSFTGLPECMLPDFKGLIVDAWRPFDERISENGKAVNISRHRAAAEKMKPAVCQRCFCRDGCEGIWKFYAKKYGCDELVRQKG